MKPYCSTFRAALFAVAFFAFVFNAAASSATVTDLALPPNWTAKLEVVIQRKLENSYLMMALGIPMGPRAEAMKSTLAAIARRKDASGGLSADSVRSLKLDTSVTAERYFLYATWFPIEGKPNPGFLMYSNGYREALLGIEYVQDLYEESLTPSELFALIAPQKVYCVAQKPVVRLPATKSAPVYVAPLSKAAIDLAEDNDPTACLIGGEISER